MKHPIASDSRYTVALENCGHASPRHVLRFCGDFIGSFQSYPAAVLRATGHRNARSGEVVTEKREPDPTPEPLTKVIFRTFKKGGEVIALFPELPGSVSGYTCSSYMQTGQHGAAQSEPIPGTRPATPEEKAPLREELESIGYRLKEVRRSSPAMRQARRNAVSV